MKQWSQSHIVLTAATVPLALLICWLVYKQRSEKRDKSEEKKKDLQSVEKNKSIPCSDANSRSSDEAVGYQSSILDAVDTDEITYTDSYVNMIDADETKQIPNENLELLQIKKSDTSINSGAIDANNPSDSECSSRTNVDLLSDAISSLSDKDVKSSPEVESMLVQNPSELSFASAAEELCEGVAPASVALHVDKALASLELLKENSSFPEQSETLSSSEMNSISSFESDLTLENVQGASVGQEDKINNDVIVAAVVMKPEDNSVISSVDENTGKETADVDENLKLDDCDAITNEPNANNNNNATDSPTHVSGDNASLPGESGSTENNTFCDSCGGDKTTTVEINGHLQNGWDSDHKSSHECKSKDTHEVGSLRRDLFIGVILLC